MPTKTTKTALPKQRRKPTAAEYEQTAALRQALQHFQRTSEKALRPQGLTIERYQLLLTIKVAQLGNQTITVSQLATRLQLAKSTTTQLVRRAENLRMLRRENSDHDARVRYLHLTEDGETRLAAAVTDLRDDRDRLLESLP